MRILVCSDTHGDFYALNQAISEQPEAEIIIHLGDGAEEAEEMRAIYPDRMVIQVKGNGDFGSRYPLVDEYLLAGKHVLMTHGHLYGVKTELYTLYLLAKEKNIDLLLFGHTHQAFQDYQNGLYVLNPGSLKGVNATYGIVDITQSGIITNVITLR